MNEKHELFLHSKTPEIARTLYNLCHHPGEKCYATNILNHLPGAYTTAGTLHKAINKFEQYGWIERSEPIGRIKPIKLTDKGKQVFKNLVAFIEILEDSAS